MGASAKRFLAQLNHSRLGRRQGVEAACVASKGVCLFLMLVRMALKASWMLLSGHGTAVNGSFCSLIDAQPLASHLLPPPKRTSAACASSLSSSSKYGCGRLGFAASPPT